MKNTVVILIFNLLSFTIRSQDDCEKFKNEPIKKFSFKVAHVSSKTNGIRSFQSFGAESAYYISLHKKNKFGFNIGLGHYYRTLMKNDGSGGYDGIDIGGWQVYAFSMTHQTLELPFCFKYNILQNKTNKTIFSFYAGVSLIYLLKGQVSFTRPELRDLLSGDYVPKEDYIYKYNLGKISYEKDFNQGIQINKFFPNNNIKITTGAEYFFSNNLGIATEYNYFIKRIGKNFRTESNLKPNNKPNYTNLSLLLILKF